MITTKKGFTLLELLIVIAIIGVLASIGYPAYSNSVKKANRADGINGLLSLAARMEEYYMNNDTYAGATVGASGNVGSDQTKEGNYTLSITAANAFSYQLSAAPNGSDPECGSLTLDSQGNKGASAGSVAQCW